VQQRDASILDQTNTIMKRDETIVRLQAEIDRLTNLNENSGLEAGELSKQLTETQRKLQEAEAMIAKL
jgi:predicted RNase H-like nuclease (RuvC/YqgF family)